MNAEMGDVVGAAGLGDGGWPLLCPHLCRKRPADGYASPRLVGAETDEQCEGVVEEGMTG